MFYHKYAFIFTDHSLNLFYLVLKRLDNYNKHIQKKARAIILSDTLTIYSGFLCQIDEGA